MKFITLFLCMLMALVGYTSAAGCMPCNPTCTGRLDVGRGGRGCVPGRMWHYDRRSRQCRHMQYLGCGGNSNRWCTRAACEEECLE